MIKSEQGIAEIKGDPITLFLELRHILKAFADNEILENIECYDFVDERRKRQLALLKVLIQTGKESFDEQR